ncbi:MAG: DNA-directed RNA polymerase subunit beta', partial [Oscillospiraceae bacterium]
RSGHESIETMNERLIGRFLVEDFCDEKGTVLVSTDKLMDENDANIITEAGTERISIRSILNCRAKHGVCKKCYGASLANGKPVQVGESVGIIAAQSIGEPGTQLTMRTFHTGGIASAEDITQGLPRVEELFEARRPKKIAIMSEIAGKVKIDNTKKGQYAIVEGFDENGAPCEKSYLIPFDQRLSKNAYDGAEIEKGAFLTDGSAAPADILAIKGRTAVQDYIIQEVQRVYRQQGVEINDKHIEVIVRQMMKKVKIDEVGSTNLIGGAMVDYKEYREKLDTLSERIENGEKDLVLPQGTDVILGITKAALATESFLSAASFRETTKVLTDAAIRGKVDPLLGLKENVIIGKLIPAGATILSRYEDEEPENILDKEFIPEETFAED